MRYIFFFLLLTTILGYGKDVETTSITSTSTIDAIRQELNSLKIPVLEFKMNEGTFPTYEIIEAPEGCIGKTIVNNEYVEGSLNINIEGISLFESGEYASKKSGVRVKVRGNSSVGIDKKSYKIKLSKKADLLFRNDKEKEDKEWVLLGYGSYFMNAYAGAETGRICGAEWEPDGRHVAVIMNDKYMGTYYLMEAVGGGKHKVEIEKTGYILENDLFWWKPGEVSFKSLYLPKFMGWTFKEPDTDDFNDMTLCDIEWAVSSAEYSLYNNSDYVERFDMEIFARWGLAHDIMGSTDAGGSNIFIVKKNFDPLNPFESKFEAGPHWDLDSAFITDSDTHAPVIIQNLFWIFKFMEKPEFQELYREIWKEVRPVLKEKLLSKLALYVEENKDIYIARQIDCEKGLIAPEWNTSLETDYDNICKWLDRRIEVLNKIILNETDNSADKTVINTEEVSHTSGDNKIFFNVKGQRIPDQYSGLTIEIDDRGKISKRLSR
ncbi:MAG: CotH kinase family protein [Muribaculaceae bacterium]|nr:CotH kinase family protein [Muribaculaceae bacterium]